MNCALLVQFIFSDAPWLSSRSFQHSLFSFYYHHYHFFSSGIVSEEDLRFIPDELFELWETANYLPDAKDSDHNALYSPSPEEEHDLDVERGLVTRYPLVVINKLRDTRDRMVALSKGSNRSKGAPLGHYLKPTTQVRDPVSKKCHPCFF